MATKQASFHCPQCQQMKLFQAHSMNHVPHILASVFLCGLWLPIWALMAMNDNPSWHCSFCGFSDQSKYLANPSLRKREADETVRKARIREQTRINRAGSTIQEHIAYFVSDNKSPITVLGIVAGAVGILIIFSTFTQRQKQSTTVSNTLPTNVQKDATDINFRRSFADFAETRYEKDRPGINFRTSGPKDEILFINSKLIDEKFVTEFRASADFGRIRDLGFSTVRIEGNKSQSWTLTP